MVVVQRSPIRKYWLFPEVAISNSRSSNGEVKSYYPNCHCWSNFGRSCNRGTPKSSILVRFSPTTHPFWGIAVSLILETPFSNQPAIRFPLDQAVFSLRCSPVAFPSLWGQLWRRDVATTEWWDLGGTNIPKDMENPMVSLEKMIYKWWCSISVAVCRRVSTHLDCKNSQSGQLFQDLFMNFPVMSGLWVNQYRIHPEKSWFLKGQDLPRKKPY